jgi:hypothetical protein
MTAKGFGTTLKGFGNRSSPSVDEGNGDFYRVRPSSRVETGSGDVD